jgi:hypothetical protein
MSTATMYHVQVSATPAAAQEVTRRQPTACAVAGPAASCGAMGASINRVVRPTNAAGPSPVAAHACSYFITLDLDVPAQYEYARPVEMALSPQDSK